MRVRLRFPASEVPTGPGAQAGGECHRQPASSLTMGVGAAAGGGLGGLGAGWGGIDEPRPHGRYLNSILSQQLFDPRV